MMAALLIRFAHLAVTNTFAALRPSPRSSRDKHIEVLAPRHQLNVPQRNLNGHRVHFTPADRALISVPARSASNSAFTLNSSTR